MGRTSSGGGDDGGQGRWVQMALLAEPEATLSIRVHAVLGEATYGISATITRPDGTWLSCHVARPTAGAAQVRAALAELIDEHLASLQELVPPF
jgi:hypothetical protein